MGETVGKYKILVGIYIFFNDFFPQIFNQSSSANSQVKNILNVFKGDANVHVSAIDTSGLYADNGVGVFDKRVKHAFHKCLKQFHGGVIPMETFQPDVTQRRINFPPAQSVRTSTLLSAYISEENEKRPKSGSHKPGTLKVESDQSSSATVCLNFEPLSETKSSDSISSKCQVTLRGLVPENFVPVNQSFEAHLSVWPSRYRCYKHFPPQFGIQRIGLLTVNPSCACSSFVFAHSSAT